MTEKKYFITKKEIEKIHPFLIIEDRYDYCKYFARAIIKYDCEWGKRGEIFATAFDYLINLEEKILEKIKNRNFGSGVRENV